MTVMPTDPKLRPKAPAKKTALTDPNKNPYPNSPSAKFINGQWVNTLTPAGKKGLAGVRKNVKTGKGSGSGGNGKTPFQLWLESKRGSKAPAGVDFDPFAAYPDAPELTPYPSSDPGSLPDGSDVGVGQARRFAQGNARLLDPNAQGRQAGQAYDPTIDAINRRVSSLQGGVAGANQMLDSAFGGAADASMRGAQVVREGNATANQSLTDLAARMAQVAGGDPTAAALVGGQSADQQAANTRSASVAEQAQADQAAAAQRDLGLAKLGYKSTTDEAVSDLSVKAGELRTAGRQDSRKAIMESLGFNSDQQTAQTSRDVAKQEAWLAGQIAGPQIEAAKLANVGTRQNLKINKDTVAKNDWTTQNQATRQNWLDKVSAVTDKATAARMKQELIKGNTPAAELALADPQAYRAIQDELDPTFRSTTGPMANPYKTYMGAIKHLHDQYPSSSSKAIKALALRYSQDQMVAWNSGHNKSQKASGKTWKVVNGRPTLVTA